MSRRIVAISALVAVGLTTAASRAEPFDFVTVLQQTRVNAGDVNAAWSAEAQQLYRVVDKATSIPGAGGGGGMGTGRKEYDGVQHRLYGYVGATSWLMLGVAQSMTVTNMSAQSGWQLGILAPEGRFKLLPLAGNPVGLSLYTGPRIRFDTRRASTAVLGLGLEAGHRSVRFAANTAFETSTADRDRENGVRYDLGVRFPIYGILSGSVEGWGVAVWPDNARFQTSHHAGPALRLKVGRAWVAAVAMAGVKDQATKTFYDYGGAMQLGMGW